MPISDRPKWAKKRVSEQDASKAARIVALVLMKDKIRNIPKTHIAEALGVSRWTLDRDIAMLPEVQEYVDALCRLLGEEADQEDKVTRL